jgi:exodeoxyribonuclease VII small subunit
MGVFRPVWKRTEEVSSVQEPSFESAFAELEEIVQQLEEGDLSLDEAMSLYEKGQQLARHCQTLLDRAELRVTELADDVQE